MLGRSLITQRKPQGFSLLELSIVLLIIGLMLGGLLPALGSQFEQRNRNRTSEELEDIKQGLYGFAVVNGRLPCPDCSLPGIGSCASFPLNDGREDVSPGPGGICAANDPGGKGAKISIGNVPWADLGVPENDAWLNRYAYGVSTEFADGVDGTSCTGSSPPGVGISIEICSPADAQFNITDAGGGLGNAVADRIPAIVISYGGRGLGSIGPTDEAENTDLDNDIVFKNFQGDSSAEPFDDIIVWLSSTILINQMLQARILP